MLIRKDKKPARMQAMGVKGVGISSRKKKLRRNIGKGNAYQDGGRWDGHGRQGFCGQVRRPLSTHHKHVMPRDPQKSVLICRQQGRGKTDQ